MTLRFVRLIAASLFASLLFTSAIAAAGQAAAPYERWYIVELDGVRSGWMRETLEMEGENLKTSTRIELQIRRGEALIKVSLESAFVETQGGEPVYVRSMQQLGSEPVVQEFIFGKDAVKVRARQGETEMPEVEAPLPGGSTEAWLTPREAREFVAARLAAGAEEITYKSLDPSNGLTVATTKHQVLERTQVEALGRTVPAIKWTTTSSLMPSIQTTDYVDLQGVPIRSEINLGMFTMTTILADRDLALAELAPPELLVSTLVTPDKPIKRPRRTKRAMYVLSVAEGELGDLPESAIQRVERLGEDRLRLTVDLTSPRRAPEADAADEAYTKATAMADSGDAAVRALMEKAVAGVDASDRAARAEAMRRFVQRHIDEKNLDVGFATASETARTRAGDCTEHGTLLVAMLRADGIPARACSGLIYVDEFAGQKNVFGYHMWSQALLEVDGTPTWVDLDATLGDETPCDATHILLATTDLGEAGMNNAMVNLAPLLGRLRIGVESAE